MNRTSLTYYTANMNSEYLNSRQLAAVTVINLIIMVANVTGNTLVIYVLKKTNQIAGIACKLIFMLSISDFLVGAIVPLFILHCVFQISCYSIILYHCNNRH